MSRKKLNKFIVSERGQWDYPGQPTAVPTEDGSITMEGVPYPVMGFVPGYPPVIMQPGGNYQFPGNMVYEIPMAKQGGWLEKYQDGAQVGPRISNLPKEEFKPTPNIPVVEIPKGKPVQVPGGHGSMKTVYVDDAGNIEETPEETKRQMAMNQIARSNNTDPIGMGILAASGAGPAARTIGAALPFLKAPLTIGSTVVPGVTVGSTIGALGAGISTQQLVDPTSETRQSINVAAENPNTENVLNAVAHVGLVGLNYAGIGLGRGLSQGARQASQYLTKQTPLKNTWRYNPWRFKANPNAYYHRSPNLKNIVNQETGMLQGFGESDAGKLFNESAGPRIGQGINLKKTANNRLYFSKGVPLDYGRYNTFDVVGKSAGSGYKGPYMVEVEGVPMGVSVKGRAPGLEPTIPGSYAVSKRPISLDEAKFYIEDWLRGYKQIDTPKQLPGSANINSSTNQVVKNTRLQNPVIQSEYNKPIPEGREPYLGKRKKPITKDEQIFRSFLSPKTQAELEAEDWIYYDSKGNIIPKSEYPGRKEFKLGGWLDKYK